MKKRIGRYINELLKIRNDLTNAIIEGQTKLVENDYWVAYIYLSEEIESIIEKIDEIIKEE